MSLGIFCIFPLRNDGDGASVARRLAVCVAVIPLVPLVGHDGSRPGTQRGIEKWLEERRVALRATSEQEGQRQAPMIALQVDFRGEPAA